MTVRHYSSSAGKMVLQLGITAVATAMQVDTTAGLPGTTPFSLLIDVGLPTEEIVTVSQVSGNTLVVVRGEDGTSAQPHANGAVVRHAITARDLRDSRDHENASAGVHGATGAVVGTTDTQTLTNKNLSSASNVFPTTLATDAELAAHAATTATHGATGAVVGTTNVQTLTGKTLQGSLQIPSTAASAAATVRGASGQTAVLQAWQDSSATTLASISKAGTFNNYTGTGGCVLMGGGDTPTIYQAYIGGEDPDLDVLRVDAPVGQTGDLIKTVTSAGSVFRVQSTGAIVSPTVTALTAADAALDTRLDTAESTLTAVDGRLDELEKVWHTTISITPSAANTPTSQTVTFPVGRFAGGVGAVQVTPLTTVPGTTVTGWGVSDITATNCKVWVTRTNTTATGLIVSVFPG